VFKGLVWVDVGRGGVGWVVGVGGELGGHTPLFVDTRGEQGECLNPETRVEMETGRGQTISARCKEGTVPKSSTKKHQFEGQAFKWGGLRTSRQAGEGKK